MKILCARQLAFEKAVLHPLSKVFQNSVNTGAAFIVFDVVGDDHIHSSPRDERRVGGNFAFEVLRQEPCLQGKTP